MQKGTETSAIIRAISQTEPPSRSRLESNRRRGGRGFRQSRRFPAEGFAVFAMQVASFN
jgi:hypothetical protein